MSIRLLRRHHLHLSLVSCHSLANPSGMDTQILLEQPPIVLRPVRDEPLLKNSLFPTGIEAKISHKNVQVLIHAINPCQHLHTNSLLPLKR